MHPISYLWVYYATSFYTALNLELDALLINTYGLFMIIYFRSIIMFVNYHVYFRSIIIFVLVFRF
jgi:hypothetical protein